MSDDLVKRPPLDPYWKAYIKQMRARHRQSEDALTAKLAEMKESLEYWETLAAIAEERAQDSPARERDAYQRGFKAALEKAAKKAEDKAYWSLEEIATFNESMKCAERVQIRMDRKFHKLAEDIRATPLPDTKGDDT